MEKEEVFTMLLEKLAISWRLVGDFGDYLALRKLSQTARKGLINGSKGANGVAKTLKIDAKN